MTENVIHLEAKILIIGSDGGLVAAVAAAEKGVEDIVVLERQGKCSRICHGETLSQLTLGC